MQLGTKTKLVSLFHIKYLPSISVALDWFVHKPLTSLAVFVIMVRLPLLPTHFFAAQMTGTFLDQKLCLLNLNEPGRIPNVCVCIWHMY